MLHIDAEEAKDKISDLSITRPLGITVLTGKWLKFCQWQLFRSLRVSSMFFYIIWSSGRMRMLVWSPRKASFPAVQIIGCLSLLPTLSKIF